MQTVYFSTVGYCSTRREALDFLEGRRRALPPEVFDQYPTSVERVKAGDFPGLGDCWAVTYPVSISF